MNVSSLFSALVLAALVGAVVSTPAQTQAERSKRTYRNPIIDLIGPADPHVIRHEGRYYLYPTLDGNGYDVFVSEDLVRWERKKGAVTEGPWMLKHKGLCYLMYSGSGTDGPDYGIGYATAPDGQTEPSVQAIPSASRRAAGNRTAFSK